MTFLHAASKSLTDIFKSDTRLTSGVPFLVVLSVLEIDLMNTVGVCPIGDGSSYKMATSLMAWHTINRVD